MYRIYELNDNDTLESLSLKYGISSDEILRLNGISESDFSNLSEIVLPNNQFFVYKVSSGDTMSDISKKFNKDINVLYAINGIDLGDYIYPNQEILIPIFDYSVYFTVFDDTLGGISKKLSVDVDNIISNNSDLFLLPEQVILVKRD